MSTIYYKIQKKSDPELFIKGTPVYHSYDKKGRIFTSLGNLRSFLTSVMNSEYRRSDITDWQVIELEMRLRDTKELHEIIKPEKFIELLKR